MGGNGQLDDRVSSGGSAAAGAETLGVDELKMLMRAVTETTERLETTHVSLRREVARLQSELAEANQQLRRTRSLAALGEMAAGIAHEIRNPLAAIQLNAQMLAEELEPTPQLVASCDRIGRAVTCMDAIVRDVLHFARERSVRPHPTTAEEIIAQAMEQCEALIAHGDVDVVTDVPPACTLEADAALVTQALANVARNAIEAMVESRSSPRRLLVGAATRRIRGAASAPRAHVVIAVEDTGPGIPADVVERMFNPFFTTRATGTGLGLAIVHRIVDAHGGHVNVRAADGTGTRVELCLPVVPCKPANESTSALVPEIEVSPAPGHVPVVSSSITRQQESVVP